MPVRSPSISETDLIKSITRDSFEEFLKEFWSVAVPNEDLIWNWHMHYLCKTLQREAERVFRGEPKKHDIIINIPPGSTKSTICSIMFPAWVWARFPQGKLICASFASKLALVLSLKSRDVIRSDKYQMCFPEVSVRDDQDAKFLYMNDRGGMRQAVGVEGSVTGFHAHFIIVDDPIDPAAAISQVQTETVNRWMADTLSTRKVSKDLTLTILIMQRLHEDDPTGNILAQVADGKRKILHICLPATVSDKIKPKGLKRYYKDGLLDPGRMSKRILKEIEGELGAYGYAGQFDQYPVPLGGGMIHADNIEVVDVPPPRRYMRMVRYWDKAASAGTGDYTVGVLLGFCRDKRFWIIDVIRGQWESATRERIIRQTAEMDGSAVRIGVEQEPAGSGKVDAQNTLANLRGFHVFLDRPGSNKILRADPFSVQVNGGNVYMCRGSWNKTYLNEMRFFPNSKYDDQVDATSGAFNELCIKRMPIGGLPT